MKKNILYVASLLFSTALFCSEPSPSSSSAPASAASSTSPDLEKAERTKILSELYNMCNDFQIETRKAEQDLIKTSDPLQQLLLIRASINTINQQMEQLAQSLQACVSVSGSSASASSTPQADTEKKTE